MNLNVLRGDREDKRISSFGNADKMGDRDSLTSRTIPFMKLSDGSDSSLTAPPPPLPHYLNAEGRAIARFAVEGNVVST